jgi:hypothetical protein
MSKLSLKLSERLTLRHLLADIRSEVALSNSHKMAAQAIQVEVNNLVRDLMEERDLNPEKYQITNDLKTITKIEPTPVAPAPAPVAEAETQAEAA